MKGIIQTIARGLFNSLAIKNNDSCWKTSCKFRIMLFTLKTEPENRVNMAQRTILKTIKGKQISKNSIARWYAIGAVWRLVSCRWTQDSIAISIVPAEALNLTAFDISCCSATKSIPAESVPPRCVHRAFGIPAGTTRKCNKQLFLVCFCSDENYTIKLISVTVTSVTLFFVKVVKDELLKNIIITTTNGQRI